MLIHTSSSKWSSCWNSFPGTTRWIQYTPSPTLLGGSIKKIWLILLLNFILADELVMYGARPTVSMILTQHVIPTIPCPTYLRVDKSISIHFQNHSSLQRIPIITYRKISNISSTKSQNLNDSHLVLKSSLPNSLKPGVKSRMKM